MAVASASFSSATAGEIPAGEAPPPRALYSFGRPRQELNGGLSYIDTFRCADADATTTLIEFYSANYKSSAPLSGEGSKLVYHHTYGGRSHPHHICLKRFMKMITWLRSKLKDLADQHNITQQKYVHQVKEKMLELERAYLKIRQHQEKAAQEQTQMQSYAELVSQLVTTEKNLRLQLEKDFSSFSLSGCPCQKAMKSLKLTSRRWKRL